jgi:hypothetical protein
MERSRNGDVARSSLWRVRGTVPTNVMGDVIEAPFDRYLTMDADCTSVTPLLIDGIGFVLFLQYGKVAKVTSAEYLGECLS